MLTRSLNIYNGYVNNNSVDNKNVNNNNLENVLYDGKLNLKLELFLKTSVYLI